MLASVAAITIHISSGGVKNNFDAAFIVVVGAANFVYLLLPMFIPGLAATLIGADIPKAKAKGEKTT